MKGIIYKATNIYDGKIYVGQTTQSLERRAAQHRSMANRGIQDPFHNAIRQFGWEAFRWEILETIEREIPSTLQGAEHYIMRPLLLEAENRYITELQSSIPSWGYNTNGGIPPSQRTPDQLQNQRTTVTVYHLHRGRRYKTYPTLQAARNEIGVGPLHNKVLDYNPDGITFQCPRCTTCVAVRFPEGIKPPLNIKIIPIRPETKAQKQKRRFHQSPFMLKKEEERRKRLEQKLNLHHSL